MKRYIYMHRRGTIEEWESANNPIPCEGEIVIELDEINKFHKLKIGDGVTPYSELAYLKAGDEIVTQVLAQARPRVVSITLDVDKWTEITCESDPNFGYYGQTVELSDITAQSRLDLQLDADMVVEFQKLDLVFVTENKGGVITVYSIGAMPLQSYTMQATIVEAEVPSDCDKVVGIPIAAKHTHSNADVLSNLSDTDGILLYNGEQISAASGSGIYIGSGDMPDGYNVQIDPDGEATEALPNPHALTFTGAVTGSYDGSASVEVNIPDSNKITDIQCNADGSLTFVVEDSPEDGVVNVTRYTTKSLKGANGNDGVGIEDIVFNDDYSMTITTEEVYNGNVYVGGGIAYTSPSLKGETGADGYTPQKGVDYWTSTDKEEIATEAASLVDLSSYATHEDVEQEVANFNFIQVLTALPADGFPNRIYLVPKTDTQTQDLFDEYVWINKGTEDEPDWGWEWVTTKQIEVDLTPYATKEYADTVSSNSLKKVYPIGSIYLTMSATNPTELFGFGEWTLISNSFLVGAGDLYEVGATGGEATHTLTIEEIPSHLHKISSSLQWANQTGNVQGGTNTYYNRSESQTTQLAGGSQPHNNMPPYIAVYMWQRTA